MGLPKARQLPGKARCCSSRAVVGDLKVHHGVVVADDEVDVLTDGAVLVVENQMPSANTPGRSFWVRPNSEKEQSIPFGRFAPELALGDVDAAGEPGVMQRRGYQIALMDILAPVTICTGASPPTSTWQIHI